MAAGYASLSAHPGAAADDGGTVPLLMRLQETPPGTSGAEDAWQAFLAEHSRLILSVARKVSNDQDEVMDAYAHVLDALRANGWARLRAFSNDGRARFTTWLVVVVRRLCIDHHRAREGRARPDSDTVARDARRNLRRYAGALGVDPDTLPAPASSDDALEHREVAGALAQALAALDPRERMLLALRFEDELSAARIAAVLRYPTPFHVYRHLNRILALLRRELERAGVGGTGR